MSEVRMEKRVFDCAGFGPLNPLPDFQNVSYVHSTVVWDDTLKEEDTRYMRYGRVSSILPYLTQDGYTRERKPSEKDVVVLENAHVRAEFLPWMGARLWSLQCDGREMLYHNPVVQPCNLALRNAWCSGGVEWNVSIRGHNMLTCEDLFTETLRLPDGTCGVRFYEYERIRGIVYRLEAYLPPESRFLFVQVHIENPVGNGERPMYWWSNIAVPEEKGTRVIAPADTAILSLYDAGQYRMLRTKLPHYEEADLSKPCGITRSVDVFYDVKPDVLPFVTALQSDHTGLVQCSTSFMRGRKLFVWGMGQGGRHWQKFLSDGSENYVEIQSGIAKTQQDHLPMPESAVWEWLEAYGSMTCDVDGLSYADAVEKCEAALAGQMTKEQLEAEHLGRGTEIANAHGEVIRTGSGWGALENLRREREHLPPVSSVCVFPEKSMTDLQIPWKTLLESGAFPEPRPEEAPGSYMIGKCWQDMLENAPMNWAALYQLAVMCHAAGETEKARIDLLRSLSLRESAWALRALARISVLEKDEENMRSYYGRALQLQPGQRSLCLEYAQTLSAFGLMRELKDYLDSLPDALRRQPRFLYLRAVACTALGEYEEAESILLMPLIIPDMREGELSLCDLWFDLSSKKHGISVEEAKKRFPLPEELDFRMH